MAGPGEITNDEIGGNWFSKDDFGVHQRGEIGLLLRYVFCGEVAESPNIQTLCFVQGNVRRGGYIRARSPPSSKTTLVY